jgi:lipid-A-disaccharide synthase
MLIKIPHIGLVNILAGKSVVRELIQDQANPPAIVAEMKRLLYDESYIEDMKRQLKVTADLLGGEGAHERAASRVAEWLRGAQA